jgi:hypothetical protein
MDVVEKDVMWSSLAWPGVEHVRWTEDGQLRADSLAVHGLEEGPARVSCQVIAEPDGRTRHVAVEVTGPAGPGRLVLSSDGEGAWTGSDGRPLPDLAGCVDVDISTTPLTNTLPIRRLGLAPGASADLLVAYVTVPQLELSAATQRYTHLDGPGSATVYRYESGSFQADLPVDGHGLVIDYPGLWQRVDGVTGEADPATAGA